MIALGREQGIATPLLEGVRHSNAAHLAHLVATVRRLVPPPGPILQLGLSFKAGTDDLRNSPLVDLAEVLVQARLRAADLRSRRRAGPPAGRQFRPRRRASRQRC